MTIISSPRRSLRTGFEPRSGTRGKLRKFRQVISLTVAAYTSYLNPSRFFFGGRISPTPSLNVAKASPSAPPLTSPPSSQPKDSIYFPYFNFPRYSDESAIAPHQSRLPLENTKRQYKVRANQIYFSGSRSNAFAAPPTFIDDIILQRTSNQLQEKFRKLKALGSSPRLLLCPD